MPNDRLPGKKKQKTNKKHPKTNKKHPKKKKTTQQQTNKLP